MTAYNPTARKRVNPSAPNPEISVPSDGVGDRLADDPDRVGPEELRGVDVDTAEDRYVGQRVAEASGSYNETLHRRATERYGKLLGADRRARRVLTEPIAGLLTGVFDPTEVAGGVGPVKQVDNVRAGLSAMSDRLRSRVGTDSATWFGVRELDTAGVAHCHLYVVGDGDVLDSLDFKAGIEAFRRATPGGRVIENVYERAVEVDRRPASTAEKRTVGDEQFGAVHPFARYVAMSLPHLGPVGEMPSHRIRQGATEWASTTTCFTTGGLGF